jgi:ATP-dependent Clp protease ATP-binding subunit ClpA
MLTQILSKFNLKHTNTPFEERFAETGWRVFHHALEETRRRRQNYLSLGHLLNALAIESPDVFNDVISHAEIEPKKAQEFIWENLESIPQQAAWQGVRIAPEVTLLVRQAQDAAQKAGRKIEAADLGQVLSKGKLEFLRTVKWKVA